ncbi:MAG: hypothetical protein WCI31_01070 [Prolixibacteraceae bacterium]
MAEDQICTSVVEESKIQISMKLMTIWLKYLFPGFQENDFLLPARIRPSDS